MLLLFQMGYFQLPAVSFWRVYHFFPIAMTPWKFQMINYPFKQFNMKLPHFQSLIITHHKNFRFSCPLWIQWLFGNEFVSPKSVMDFLEVKKQTPKTPSITGPLFVMDRYKIPVAQGCSWKKSFWNISWMTLDTFCIHIKLIHWWLRPQKKHFQRTMIQKKQIFQKSTSERNITELERYFSC